MIPRPNMYMIINTDMGYEFCDWIKKSTGIIHFYRTNIILRKIKKMNRKCKSPGLVVKSSMGYQFRNQRGVTPE